jgi:hypothetical protein
VTTNLQSPQTSVAGAGGKAPVASPIATPVAWAIGFLKGIGAKPTKNNVDAIIAWGIAESGQPGTNQGHGGWTNFNPLNIVTQSGDNHTGQGGSQGNIADFGTLQDGVNASVRLFTNNPNAAPIISALKNNASVAGVNNAVNRFYSSWGGSINFAGINPSAAVGNVQLDKVNLNPLSADFWKNFATGGLVGAITDTNNPFTSTLDVLKVFGGIGVFISHLLDNWRYVVQFLAGAALTIVGFLLILHDTGVGGKAAKAGATVAAIAA